MAAGRRKRLGDFGERLAAARLDQAGLRIVERKWRCSAGEIDLVAHEGETLVFVEVRTRRAGAPGSPEESLGPRKRRRLAELTYTYLAESPTLATAWRIDVVAIEVAPDGRVTRVQHHRDAIEEL